MDQVDRSFQEETARINAMIKLSSNYKSHYKHTGNCLNCEATVMSPKLYCDDRCADGHAKKEYRLGPKH